MRYIFIGYDSSSKGYKPCNPNSDKIVISRDVEFDKEYFWNWRTQEEEKYDFFHFLEEKEESRNEEFTAPSPSPTNSSTPSSSSSRGSASEMPPHMRSLQELYEVTNNLNDDLTLYCHFADCEPLGFEEAVKDEIWKNAMDEKIKAIKKNNTWELTTIPKEQKPIGVKWVFKVKKNAKGEIERYKVRLVVKGYSQQPNIDYGEGFALVAWLKTIRMVISLVAQNKWKIYQMDVKSAFLNGILEKKFMLNNLWAMSSKGMRRKF
jgi:hypothetical protein